MDKAAGNDVTEEEKPQEPFLKRHIKDILYLVFLTIFMVGMIVALIFVWDTGAKPPPPANDRCENAIMVPVDGSRETGSLTRATADTQGNKRCGSARGDSDSIGVWYSFTATSDATRIDGRSFAIYSGDCNNLTSEMLLESDPNAENASAYQDDVCADGSFIFPTVANKTYQVYTAASSDSKDKNVFLSARNIESPSNDMCRNAIELEDNGSPLQGDLLAATYSQNPGTYEYIQGVWYYVKVDEGEEKDILVEWTGFEGLELWDYYVGVQVFENCSQAEVYLNVNPREVRNQRCSGSPYPCTSFQLSGNEMYFINVFRGDKVLFANSDQEWDDYSKFQISLT